ncbi:MAG: 4Fe-4S binding protein [Spirochaetes bacterium]|nr:4Fe-4S binding protein [Spirochaetota bacterium]
MFRYGPPKLFVKIAVALSWPIMILGKRLSAVPIVKHIINPFFKYPYNEVTAVPINVAIAPAKSVTLPVQVLSEVVARVNHIFILDECICRSLLNCSNHPRTIGCMALGEASHRIHPSHGHRATAQEAQEHIAKAAKAGLVASVAHVWIDPVAFWSVPFNKLMFICFCDDCCCLYRTHMKKRGENLNKAYKKLPGVTVRVNFDSCNGCGVCAQRCFVAAIQMKDGIAVISEDCKGCGRCVQVCPQQAVEIYFDDKDTLVANLVERINKVADIGLGQQLK